MDRTEELRWSWRRAAAIAAESQPVIIETTRGPQHVRPNEETRRLLRAAFRHAMRLRREKQTRDRLQWYILNRLNRRELFLKKHLQRHQIKLRVRSRDLTRTVKSPDYTHYVNGRKKDAAPGNFSFGTKQGFTDYSPVLFVKGPIRLNPMQGTRYWQNSTSSTMSATYSGLYNATVSFPKGKWTLNGLYGASVPTDISIPLGFEDGYAQKALQKAIAKIKDPDLHLNEYTVEALQVMRLLVDPLRTIRRYHRLLERWTRRDNWIWIPQRTYRRFNGGVLVSQVPLGGVLMSMRTRRTMSVSDVARGSRTMLDAAANRWLQYRYGVMPLVSDVTTILGGLAERPFGTQWNVKGARVWVNRPPKTISEYTRRWAIVDVRHKLVKQSGLHYTAKQFYKLDRLPPLSYVLGVHPSQWLRNLWNVTPYSFVADWWLDVDTALAAATTMPGLTLGPNMVTAKEFTTVTCTVLKAAYYSTPYFPINVFGSPIARKGSERVNRHININHANRVLYSTAWAKLKNKLTLGALTLSKFKVVR